jgi:hypothetical protein
MSLAQKWGPLLVVLVLLLGAGAWLFQLRLSGGDLYPPYSSLRADAVGTRALYEALGQIPGMQVERDYRPLARLPARAQLVFIPGLEWQQWVEVPANELGALNAAAHAGGRVVLAFHADLLREERDDHGRPVVEDDEDAPPVAGETKPDKKAEEGKAGKNKKPRPPGVKVWERVSLTKAWGVTLKQRWLMAKEPGAIREPAAGEDLPGRVSWKSDLYFSLPAGSDWKVLYRRAKEPVLIEKKVGNGSIVLLADAYCLSNESVHRDRSTGLLSWLVGTPRRATFLEGPLGVLEDNGMGYLARRYGLGGAVALCVLVGLLYAWRQAVSFLPPQTGEQGSRGEVALAYEPTVGFTGLLRRSLPPGELLPACVAEWHKGRQSGGTPAATARLLAVWQARTPRQSISTTYNALVRALKPR